MEVPYFPRNKHRQQQHESEITSFCECYISTVVVCIVYWIFTKKSLAKFPSMFNFSNQYSNSKYLQNELLTIWIDWVKSLSKLNAKSGAGVAQTISKNAITHIITNVCKWQRCRQNWNMFIRWSARSISNEFSFIAEIFYSSTGVFFFISVYFEYQIGGNVVSYAKPKPHIFKLFTFEVWQRLHAVNGKLFDTIMCCAWIGLISKWTKQKDNWRKSQGSKSFSVSTFSVYWYV